MFNLALFKIMQINLLFEKKFYLQVKKTTLNSEI